MIIFSHCHGPAQSSGITYTHHPAGGTNTSQGAPGGALAPGRRRTTARLPLKLSVHEGICPPLSLLQSTRVVVCLLSPSLGGPHQCSRLKSSMPFKRDSALQNIPVPKQPFRTQPQIENEEDVT